MTKNTKTKDNTKVSVANTNISNISHNKVGAGLNKKKEYKINSNDEIFNNEYNAFVSSQQWRTLQDGNSEKEYGSRADFVAYQEWRALQKKNKMMKKRMRAE